jgi:hypothetical protein
MITEIRLSQLKDTYEGNEDILIPLIKLLKKSPFNIEFVVVTKSPEWLPELQVYEPVSDFSYLVRAYKLAYPKEQSDIYIYIVIADDCYQMSNHQQQLLIESSKLKVLISKGEQFITAYANSILKQEKILSPLSLFSDLVNKAEGDNDSE